MYKVLNNILALLIVVNVSIYGQFYKISGKVTDKSTGNGLSYANLRICDQNLGTASNIEGNYELNLKKGTYLLMASFIGFRSDTVKLEVFENRVINFQLSPIEIEIAEVTVEPGINPANSIIKNTITTKNEIKDKINNYKYSSYTKGLIKTTRDFGDGSFTLSTQDTGKLKITGILENESRGFFRKPDDNKHFIVARKQTANTPPFINILTGGLVIQSFYEDNLNFMNRDIPSPISDDALSYYYFYIEEEIAIDDQKVFQIYFNTDNPAAPGFYGRLFIADSTFHLLKVDVSLNQMANPGGLFNFVKIYQQFTVLEDNIVMPIDYRLFAEGNYLGLAKFGFELHTIMNSYNINTEIDSELFDNAVITVLPEADKKEDSYWASIQSIPNTQQEEHAYSRIDSLQAVSKTFGQDFSLLASELKINDNFSFTGPLSIYSFNKVQGNTLNLGLYYNDAERQRLYISGDISYGFSDKKFKKELGINYLLGEYRTAKISVDIYDKVNDLFGSSDNYNKFTSTFLSLFTKYDFRDYYYSNGIDVNFDSEITPIISLGLGYFSRNYKSALNNSDFSFFYTDRNYSINPTIYNSNINTIKTSFKLDFRKFIEDGFYRRRITPRNNIQFEGSAIVSEKNILGSDLDFSIYELNTYGSLITVGNWSLDFSANQITSDGSIPLQLLNALSGNITASGKNNSFRTLRIGEVFGDRVTTIFLRHNFLDDVFKYSQIPVLKDLQLQLSTHLNIALSDISKESRAILDKEYKKFSRPFYELGFSIGHVLIPLTFEFTWKLNYRNKNNFVFGINTFAF